MGAECTKAVELVEFAKRHGWDATAEGGVEDGVEYVDVALSSRWAHPDTGHGWEWGTGVRWYATGPDRWRLGVLDGKSGRSVAGIARELRNWTPAREFAFWLRSLTTLRAFIVDPADLVSWLVSLAPVEAAS